LDYFLRKRETAASILLGLSFSFHPAVGLWAILAVGLVLVFERRSFKTILRVVAVTGLFSLIGAINLFGETHANLSDWKFFVTERAPEHLNPFYWSAKGFAVLAFMSAFCQLADLNFFLKKFLTALGIFFVVGLLFRVFEQWQLLCLMPMRIFPVFVPLFFFFTFAKSWKEKSFSTTSAFLAICVFVSLLWWQKSELMPFMQIKQTIQAWTNKIDDETKAYLWLRENTPEDAVCLTPPDNRTVWYYSHRGQFVSFSYPPFEKMTEWRERLAKIVKDKSGSVEMNENFNNLSAAELQVIIDNYRADYLVSEGDYTYQKLFESGNWKVYRLGIQR
jgi:hypothetical protein